MNLLRTMPSVGIEPTATSLKGLRSTDWAKMASKHVKVSRKMFLVLWWYQNYSKVAGWYRKVVVTCKVWVHKKKVKRDVILNIVLGTLTTVPYFKFFILNFLFKTFSEFSTEPSKGFEPFLTSTRKMVKKLWVARHSCEKNVAGEIFHFRPSAHVHVHYIKYFFWYYIGSLLSNLIFLACLIYSHHL